MDVFRRKYLHEIPLGFLFSTRYNHHPILKQMKRKWYTAWPTVRRWYLATILTRNKRLGITSWFLIKRSCLARKYPNYRIEKLFLRCITQYKMRLVVDNASRSISLTSSPEWLFIYRPFLHTLAVECWFWIEYSLNVFVINYSVNPT